MQSIDSAAYHPEAFALIRAFIANDYWTATQILGQLDKPDGPGIAFAMVLATAASKLVTDSYGRDKAPALELLDKWLEGAVKDQAEATQPV